MSKVVRGNYSRHGQSCTVLENPRWDRAERAPELTLSRAL